MPDPTIGERIRGAFRDKDALRPKAAVFSLTATSAGRVLGELAGLLLLASLTGLINGAAMVAAIYGVQWEVSDLLGMTQLACSAVLGAWLTWRVRQRPDPKGTPRWWPPLRTPAAGVLALTVFFTAIPIDSMLHDDVGPALFGCAVAWLAVEVCRAHGVWADNGAPYTAVQRLHAWQIAQMGFVACAATGFLFGWLAMFFLWIGPDSVPVMQDDQLSALGISGPVELVLAVVRAVVIEDVVIVAATVTLMKAVRRPTWEIYTLICLIEVALHAYFGLPAIGAAVMAAGRVWLYLRYRSLLPLMVSHALWDFVPTLQSLPSIPRMALGIGLILTVSLVDTRLKKAAGKGKPSAPSPVAPAAAAGDEVRNP
ncbi:CPBP family intramembrane metalloprotease [Streptomyces sp. BH-SS-21]|uniref:CPBP family intramembrane metalloprotease n=1 Tax=Streptomyces liliiviolaceus TaxID=2823109 RepID=A0A941BC66_9ACTN|nr:CPBP family intramembrane glutamic endopeptidase [Streptomyces liliiviolaceus]MBQ0852883.1 CPBP family intramembrane metalloprotease [Streptomyces liliiviolaceus]